jgi:hypothetical protein
VAVAARVRFKARKVLPVARVAAGRAIRQTAEQDQQERPTPAVVAVAPVVRLRAEMAARESLSCAIPTPFR